MLARTPKSPTMAALERAAVELAAKGPTRSAAPMMPQSPYVDGAGRILDVAKNLQFVREQRAGLHQPPAKPCSAPQVRDFMHRDYCKCGYRLAMHTNGRSA